MVEIAVTPKRPKAVKIIGIIQIATGILLVAFGVVVLTILQQSYFINNNAAPIWAGICLICTGILGICAFVYHDENWLGKTFLGSNILSIVLLFIDACLSLAGIVYYEACPEPTRSPYRYRGYYYFQPTYPPCMRSVAGSGVFSVLLVLSIAGTIASIIGLIKICKSCKSNCGRSKKDSTFQLLMKKEDMDKTEVDLAESGRVVTLPDGKEYILMPYSVVEDLPKAEKSDKLMHKDM